MMKRKIFPAALLAVLIALALCGTSFADRSMRYSGSAKEFQKALDDGITNIIITSSFSGNFVIPQWVYSNSGSHSEITISPSDESEGRF